MRAHFPASLQLQGKAGVSSCLFAWVQTQPQFILLVLRSRWHHHGYICVPGRSVSFEMPAPPALQRLREAKGSNLTGSAGEEAL